MKILLQENFQYKNRANEIFANHYTAQLNNTIKLIPLHSPAVGRAQVPWVCPPSPFHRLSLTSPHWYAHALLQSPILQQYSFINWEDDIRQGRAFAHGISNTAGFLFILGNQSVIKIPWVGQAQPNDRLEQPGSQFAHGIILDILEYCIKVGERYSSSYLQLQ